jgi:hypothetical protein
MTTNATAVITAVIADANGNPFTEEQVIDREPIEHDIERDLSTVSLSAADLGCEPGTLYRVSLVDDEDRVLGSREVVAL